MAAKEEKPLAITDKAEGVESGATSLDVGGLAVKLDNLGPMIINSDGTMSRITNWAELSDVERERTVRLLVKKRNLVRLNQLEQQEAQQGTGDGNERLSALKDA